MALFTHCSLGQTVTPFSAYAIQRFHSYILLFSILCFQDAHKQQADGGARRRRSLLDTEPQRGVTAVLFLNDGVTLATAGPVPRRSDANFTSWSNYQTARFCRLATPCCCPYALSTRPKTLGNAAF